MISFRRGVTLHDGLVDHDPFTFNPIHFINPDLRAGIWSLSLSREIHSRISCLVDYLANAASLTATLDRSEKARENLKDVGGREDGELGPGVHFCVPLHLR